MVTIIRKQRSQSLGMRRICERSGGDDQEVTETAWCAAEDQRKRVREADCTDDKAEGPFLSGEDAFDRSPHLSPLRIAEADVGRHRLAARVARWNRATNPRRWSNLRLAKEQWAVSALEPESRTRKLMKRMKSRMIKTKLGV